MVSIKELFKIGYGPSSSHTMGPRKASEIFLGAIKMQGHSESHFTEASLQQAKGT